MTATAPMVQHQPDRVERDDPRVGAQRVQVGEERRRVEQRRQEDEQHEVGIELRRRASPGTNPSSSPPSTSGIG